MPLSLLKKTRTRSIEIHNDPLSTRPSAISKFRKFKINKLEQEEIKDLNEGTKTCRFCNPILLDQNSSQREDDSVIKKHNGNRVISYENAAPFLPGDQRVICVWNEDREKRYKYAHRFSFNQFGIVEYYYLLRTARDLARKFPTSTLGEKLQKKELNPIRCIAGYNIGKLAGQSMPHFHLQYGWDVVLPESYDSSIGSTLMDLYYEEMDSQDLILWEDDILYILVPWTPKGQYHVEVHFKKSHELRELVDNEVKILAYLSNYIMRIYEKIGIRNMNIIYVGSPYKKEHLPFYVQFIPRSNTTALYEMIGINVVDTHPSEITTKFDVKWRDVLNDARKCNMERVYDERFNDSKVSS